MGILSWIIVGLIAGWLANVIMKDGSDGLVGNIVLGVIGSFIGGFLMNLIGGHGVTGFNIYSILVATGGAVVLIAILRMIRKK